MNQFVSPFPLAEIAALKPSTSGRTPGAHNVVCNLPANRDGRDESDYYSCKSISKNELPRPSDLRRSHAAADNLSESLEHVECGIAY